MIKIRKAKLSDAKQLAELDKKWFNEGVSPYRESESDADQMKDIISNRIVFVAEEGTKIVGFIVLSEKVTSLGAKSKDLNPGDKYTELESFYVLAKTRGKGIGKSLLRRAISEAKKIGYKKVRFVIDSKDQDAHIKFYKQFGGKRMWTYMKIDLD